MKHCLLSPSGNWRWQSSTNSSRVLGHWPSHPFQGHQKKHSQKCAFCGEDAAYTFCTICPGEPILHFYPTKGDGKGRGCIMDYHSDTLWYVRLPCLLLLLLCHCLSFGLPFSLLPLPVAYRLSSGLVWYQLGLALLLWCHRHGVELLELFAGRLLIILVRWFWPCLAPLPILPFLCSSKCSFDVSLCQQAFKLSCRLLVPTFSIFIETLL